MPAWLMYATLSVVSSTIFNVLLKMASGTLNFAVASIVLQVAAVLPGLAFILYRTGTMPTTAGTTDAKAVVLMALAGIVIGLTNIFIFLMFQKGAPLGISTAYTRVGNVALALVVGALLFAEPVTPSRLLGFALAVPGIWLMLK